MSAKNEYKGKLLNRWPRAIARLCDLAWQMALVMGLLVYVINKQGQSLALNSVLFYALLFASIPVALLLDAIVAVLLGNTPAKIVIGVRATTSRGERLNPLVHLLRNIGVWTDGIALGFAPLSFLTMVRQFKRVSGRREAIYDEKLHVRMRSGSYCGIRAFIAAPLFIGIALLIFAGLLGFQ